MRPWPASSPSSPSWGIDKFAVAGNDEEKLRHIIQDKVANVLKRGRYIPFVDHLVPPDVSWEQFQKYRAMLNAVIDESVY